MDDLYRVASCCLLALAILLIVVTCATASGGRILFTTTWDDNYLYAGFVVDDPHVVGTNKSPDSKPWEDDDIELFLDAECAGATVPSPGTTRMAVSAAGGSSFASGKDGDWQSRRIVTYKYGATVQGTLNNPEDSDRSFSVEIALPWSEIGIKPEIGQVFGVNVLRVMQGELRGIVALSPGIQSVADVHNPSKWTKMTLTGPGTAPEIADPEQLVCPRVNEQSPLIDGSLKAREWRSAAALYINQPLSADSETDPTGDPQERIRAKDGQYPKDSIFLSPYYYWYQSGLNTTVPTGLTPASTDQPIRGLGPWMSYDRPQWHKDELLDMRKAGVDVVLPVYRGDAASRAGYASRGLDSLAQALMDLKAEGQSYPLVAMFFDTSSMATAYGGQKPDLRDEEVQRSFYGMISDFFSRIPEEFLFMSQLDESRGKVSAYVVVLSSSESFSDFDPGFIQFCNRSFAKDFGGGRLIWIADAGFAEKAPVMDGYISFGAGLGLKFNDTGWLDIAAVGPGFDEVLPLTGSSTLRSRPRANGNTYKDDWTELISKKPDWVIIESWNGLHEGSEICPTREHGFNYAELTAMETARFRGMREYKAVFLRHNTPQAIVPQAIHQVEVVVKNGGTRPWKAGQAFALSYRWFKDGKYFDDGVVKTPLQRDVLAGQIATLTVGVLAQDKNGQAMPPGNYEIHYEILGGDIWFSDVGDTPLVTPVRIGLPTIPRARFISSNLPAIVKTGASYPFTVKIRNDGASEWKKGSTVSVMCRMYKAHTYTHEAPDQNFEPVELRPVNISLPSDIPPGRIMDLSGTLQLVGKDGKPIPAQTQQYPWSYRLRWVLWAEKRWLGESDGSPYSQTITVVDTDGGPQLVKCQMPREIEAGKTVIASVDLKNSGGEPWKNGQYQLGCRWYRLDGTEIACVSPRAALKPTPPGETATVQAKVTSPAYDGQYQVVWGVMRNGDWISGVPGVSTLVIPVTVKNGKLTHVDLQPALNVAALSQGDDCKSGDFDGMGHSFPSDLFPPEILITGTASELHSGYRCSTPDTNSMITFRYPNKNVDNRSAIRCEGQSLTLKQGKYATIHILGAAITPTCSGKLGLQYDTGAVEAEITMTSWEKLEESEKPGLRTQTRHSAEGPEPGVNCYLKHYEVKIDPTKNLKSIRLPQSPDMRIVAITLERP